MYTDRHAFSYADRGAAVLAEPHAERKSENSPIIPIPLPSFAMWSAYSKSDATRPVTLKALKMLGHWADCQHERKP